MRITLNVSCSCLDYCVIFVFLLLYIGYKHICITYILMLLMSVYKTVTEEIKVMFFFRFATDANVIFLSGVTFGYYLFCTNVVSMLSGWTLLRPEEGSLEHLNLCSVLHIFGLIAWKTWLLVRTTFLSFPDPTTILKFFNRRTYRVLTNRSWLFWENDL